MLSLTAVFPAYNDSASIAAVVGRAFQALPQVSADYEIVVVNDGSQDDTAAVLDQLAAGHDRLRVITHAHNRGYGRALRTGFESARKDWIFYTDGDGQYDPAELVRLAAALRPGIDVVNGYKLARQDAWYRTVLGRLYHAAVKAAFGLPLRDTDCDFRLFRRADFERLTFQTEGGAFPLELVKQFHDAGLRFAEVPVHHYARRHGRSQFFTPRRLGRTAAEVARLWWWLVVRRQHARLAPPAAGPRG
jgi:glycosyltransferase involved in cell wall biosynthesis